MWQGTQNVLFLYFIDVFHFIYEYVLFLLQQNWKSWHLRSMLSVLCDSLIPDQTFRCNVIFELHFIWSCVPVWMKHVTHNLFLGVNIFSFALIKIINKLTNNEHTELLNHMQKTVLCCDPVWKLYFLKFEELHVDTLYCCDLWRKLTQNLIFWVVIQSSWKVEAAVWQNCKATLSLWPHCRYPFPRLLCTRWQWPHGMS
jgi:hypothetical protein